MKTIKIGEGITASAVSLGCMRMSKLDDRAVDAIMDTAIENGITYFDHADIYGGGKSETLFGGYLSRHKVGKENG